jgi:putative transposase
MMGCDDAIERLNKELKRRSAVVGIFPNRVAVLRLFCALLAEQHDEWLVGHRYFSEGSMRKLLRPPDESLTLPTEATAA